MDRAILIRHLAEAEAHVAQGERHVARQREIVDELRRNGLSTKDAVEILATFELLQITHVGDRDRLRVAVRNNVD